MPDHVHILVSIPPKYSVAQFVGYLKGKSALMISCLAVLLRFFHPAFKSPVFCLSFSYGYKNKI